MSEVLIEVGRKIVRLSLDASIYLYKRINVPEDAIFANSMFKSLVREASFPIGGEELGEIAVKKLQFSDGEEKELLDWVVNVYAGNHRNHPDISNWSSVLLRLQHGWWQHERMSETERSMCMHFIRYCIEMMDRYGFVDLANKIKEEYEITEWDRFMHIRYEFNYFDTTVGADPFLTLSFIDEGERLRQAVRTYPFPADFPHEKFRTAAWIDIETVGGWNAPGYMLCPILDIAK